MIKSYGKINLGLSIDLETFSFTSKHKLKSLFIIYKNLYDEIFINESDDNTDQVIYYENGQKIIYEDCLVLKTIQYLRNNNFINKYYKITINKHIPAKSGLGGASSNAACVIKHLYNNYLSLNMLEIALELGSDIPFFLYGYEYGIVSEFGNKVEEVKINTNLKIDVYLTPYKFSTKEVFNNFFDITKETKICNDFNKIISDLNNNIIPSNITNDLFDSSKLLSNEWFEIYNELSKKNALVIMSGSGGSIVSINKVRTRYAPSPTGYFHIGGARTAIFNYLFAKHNNGDFIVRIEDTDLERNVENGIESQLNNLDWLGVDIDESINNPGQYAPYIQSAKLERYKELANKLLNEGKAYYCFCDEETLEKDREEALKNHQTPKYSRRCLHLSNEEKQALLNKNVPKVIRLKIDENANYAWNDLIRGDISVPGQAMTDPVILKSTGVAMYNFAVVVDDVDMLISHVLRGEEHISNTPYQLAIKEALGFDNEIKYGHLSVIIDESGKKLSKRNKAMKQFIEDYKNMGFLPESVFNFLGLLSWSNPDNEEILSKDDFIKSFSTDRLSKSPTFFDYKKMLWIGNEYFKKISNEQYLTFVKPFITIELSSFLKNNLDELLLLFKNQISYATQLNEIIEEYFINNSVELSNEAKEIIANNLDVVNSFKDKITNISQWTIEEISNVINEVKKDTNKKGKDLFMPIRISASNLMHGPELAKILYFLEQKTILINIDRILKV